MGMYSTNEMEMEGFIVHIKSVVASLAVFHVLKFCGRILDDHYDAQQPSFMSKTALRYFRARLANLQMKRKGFSECRSEYIAIRDGTESVGILYLKDVQNNSNCRNLLFAVNHKNGNRRRNHSRNDGNIL
jgi:uncharacterized Fe-S cluster-containing protein